jgi:flagellar biosynthetic protein FliR
VTLSDATLTTALLVLARVAGLVGSSPVFGHMLVPPRVRTGIAAVLALAVIPPVAAAHAAPPVPLSVWDLAGMVIVEATIGVLLGLVAQFLFAGVSLGGQLAGMQMGFGMANLIDPSTHAQLTVVAQWQQLLAILVFLVLDVHHLLLRALLSSFTIVPPGTLAIAALDVRGALALAGDMFTVGVRVAAPVLVALLLTNGAMGVLARTIPQLNVFVVGFPVNAGVGLIVLGASLPFTFRLLTARFSALEPALAGLLGGLARG